MDKQTLMLLGFMVFWIVLQRWILPRFGISTCMSGACEVKPKSSPTKESDTKATEAETS